MVEDFYRHRQEYGYIMRMGSHVFFNGMALGETNKINIEDGKTLVIKYLGLGDLNEDGTRNVHFELNGMRREVAVPDKSATAQVRKVNLADPSSEDAGKAPLLEHGRLLLRPAPDDGVRYEGKHDKRKDDERGILHSDGKRCAERECHGIIPHVAYPQEIREEGGCDSPLWYETHDQRL